MSEPSPTPASSPALRRVLVTGAAGFIGSNFVRHLLAVDPGIEVLCLDRLGYTGFGGNLEGVVHTGRAELVVGDIADEALVASLFARFQPDTLVHLAAETHVDRSIHEPGAFFHSNLRGTMTLLEAARQAWEGRSDVRFHHVSTDEVYGSRPPGEAPSAEGSPYAPNSPYAATKAGSDHLVRAWSRTYGLPVSTTWSCNIYGPRQHAEKLIPLMILRAAAGQELPVYGDGQQTREWLHVSDQCAAILAVLRQGAPGSSYNISSQRAVSNLGMVQAICAAMDARRPDGAPHARLIRHVPDRPAHDTRYALDSGAITRELGWRPQVDLSEGLGRTLDWYLSRPDWVAAVAGEAYAAWSERIYGEGRGWIGFGGR